MFYKVSRDIIQMYFGVKQVLDKILIRILMTRLGSNYLFELINDNSYVC